MTTTTIFKTPASSPPKFPSTPLLTPTQTPQNSLTDNKAGPTCKLTNMDENDVADVQKLPDIDEAHSF